MELSKGISVMMSFKPKEPGVNTPGSSCGIVKGQYLSRIPKV
jgi:hypothetical protein